MRCEYVGGSYPNLCSGKLTVWLDDGSVYEGGIISGGSVWFDGNWEEHVEWGEWTIDVPDLPEGYEDKVTEWVNKNIPYGCCGGCV